MDDEARIRIWLGCALALVFIMLIPFVFVTLHDNTADHDANGLSSPPSPCAAACQRTSANRVSRTSISRVSFRPAPMRRSRPTTMTPRRCWTHRGRPRLTNVSWWQEGSRND